MASIELRKAVTARKRVTYTQRRALHANKCDACGRVYTAEKWNANEPQSCKAHGTFHPSSPCEGNGFFADVCSFECAGKLMAGGWRKMKAYKCHAKAGGELVRLELHMTRFVYNEAESVKQWEESAPLADEGFRFYITGVEP